VRPGTRVLKYNGAVFGEKNMSVLNFVCGYASRAVGVVLALVSALAAPGAVAQALQSSDPDPWEGLNRQLYAFNELFDGYIVRPVAVTYNKAMPGFARRGVHNFLENLDDVNVVANDLFQLKMNNAMRDSGRLLLNSTAGLGGFLDVASEVGLYKSHEDFGQTLGHWGVGDGGYMVLPFLGASTLRDTIGFIPDTLLNPLGWAHESEERAALFALDTVDTRLGYLAAESMITGDEYEFVRNAYLQRREYLVNDGKVYDEFDEF
jgi:phospholipid-binding lipoprotein MlaA